MVTVSAQHPATSLSGQGNKLEKPSLNKKINEWLSGIISREKPTNEIIAYNIGLFQTAHGYTAYLCGAKKYSAEDDDWATEEAFTPKERYFPFPPELAKGMIWKQAEKVTIDAVRAFLAENPNSFLAKAKAVTVGFDDGDLVRIK